MKNAQSAILTILELVQKYDLALSISERETMADCLITLQNYVNLHDHVFVKQFEAMEGNKI